MSIVDSGVAGIGDVGGVGGVSQLGDLLVKRMKRYREGEPCLEAPRIGFEPVTYWVTDSSSEKCRLVNLLRPEKAVRIFRKGESARMLFGYYRAGPLGQCFYRIV